MLTLSIETFQLGGLAQLVLCVDSPRDTGRGAKTQGHRQRDRRIEPRKP